MGKNNIEVNMLQKANDTLLFCKDKIHMTIKGILRCFELALGLNVNFHKSKLGNIRVKSYMVDIYVAILNCKNMSLPLPLSYLGIFIRGNLRRVEMWEPMLSKIRKN